MPEGYAWLEKAGLIGALFVGLIALGKRLFVPIITLHEQRDYMNERYIEMKAMKDAQIAEWKEDSERWRNDYRTLEEDMRRSLRIAETIVKSKDTP